MKSISFEQLVDYIENHLAPQEAASIALRLVNDAEAQKTVTWLRQFAGWHNQVQLPKPSSTVVDRLVAQHSAKFGHKQQPSLWQQIVATLSFDSTASRQPMAVAGLRSAEARSVSRQLTFTTPVVDIILDIDRTQQQRTIRGQMLPKKNDFSDAFVVQLVHNDSEAGVTHTDELGEFSLESKVQGDVQLIFSNDTMEIWLPPLELIT